MHPRLRPQGRTPLNGWATATGNDSPASEHALEHVRRTSGRAGSRSSVLFDTYDGLSPGGAGVGLVRLKEDGDEEAEEADERTQLRTPVFRARERGERSGRNSP